jgi:parallel beta-helix repeat protein
VRNGQRQLRELVALQRQVWGTEYYAEHYRTHVEPRIRRRHAVIGGFFRYTLVIVVCTAVSAVTFASAHESSKVPPVAIELVSKNGRGRPSTETTVPNTSASSTTTTMDAPTPTVAPNIVTNTTTTVPNVVPTVPSPTTVSSPTTLPPTVSTCIGVAVPAGASIQSFINANSGATTFCLTGSYSLVSALVPKPGNSFVGPATLDGGNTAPQAFQGNGNSIDNVTIRALTVQYFNPLVDRAALDEAPGSGWVLENNDVSYNSTEGIGIGNGAIVRNNHIHHNGELGITGYKDIGATVSGNEVDHNNTSGFDQSMEAGGMKFAGTTSLTVSHNFVHDNYGVGIWTDTNDTGYLIDGNTVTNNSHHGIKIEAALSGTVSNNTVSLSGFLAPVQGTGNDGINVDRSASVTEIGNDVSCSQHLSYEAVNGSTVINGGSNTSAGC